MDGLLDGITLDTLDEEVKEDEVDIHEEDDKEEDLKQDPEVEGAEEKEEDEEDLLDVDDEEKEEEIEIDIVEFVKEDYKELEDLGLKITPELEREMTELLDDGFSPEQISKLYKRALTKKSGGKKNPVTETAKEASARLNKELPKEVKKNYKEITKLIDEVYVDYSKEEIKAMKRSTQLIVDLDKLVRAIKKEDGVDINAERVKSRTRPKEVVTVDKAIDKYHELQSKSKTREEQEKAREKIAKLLKGEDRDRFIDETYVFDPKKAW